MCRAGFATSKRSSAQRPEPDDAPVPASPIAALRQRVEDGDSRRYARRSPFRKPYETSRSWNPSQAMALCRRIAGSRGSDGTVADGWDDHHWCIFRPPSLRPRNERGNNAPHRRLDRLVRWSGMGKPYMSLRPSRRPQPSRCSQGWGLNPSGRPRLLRGAPRN